jgi:hypothetical protein
MMVAYINSIQFVDSSKTLYRIFDVLKSDMISTLFIFLLIIILTSAAPSIKSARRTHSGSNFADSNRLQKQPMSFADDRFLLTRPKHYKTGTNHSLRSTTSKLYENEHNGTRPTLSPNQRNPPVNTLQSGKEKSGPRIETFSCDFE